MSRKNGAEDVPGKIRLVVYLTKEEKAAVADRAKAIHRTMSDYIAELVMWDTQHNLVEKPDEVISIKNKAMRWLKRKRNASSKPKYTMPSSWII